MQAPRRLTCRELVELATDYLEGALSPGDRARFDRHLAGCPGCAAYLDQRHGTLAVLGRLDEDLVDPAVLEILLEAFRDWKATEHENV